MPACDDDTGYARQAGHSVAPGSQGVYEINPLVEFTDSVQCGTQALHDHLGLEHHIGYFQRIRRHTKARIYAMIRLLQGKGDGEMRKILTGLCMILVLSVATSVHSKLVEPKQFGRCAVGTEVDEVTQGKSPRLICLGKGDNSGDSAVVLSCRQQGFATLLQAGTQSHTAETIDVAYRFDKEKLSTESWRYTANIAVNLVEGVHHRFVESIAKANKLEFEVGKGSRVCGLNGKCRWGDRV